MLGEIELKKNYGKITLQRNKIRCNLQASCEHPNL